jgi:inorganic pyrophosphatase
MISLDKLDAFNGDELTVIIETPKGSQNKYTYEPGFGAFVLDGVLPAGAVFPFDFGFVHQRLGRTAIPWMCWFSWMRSRSLAASLRHG